MKTEAALIIVGIAIAAILVVHSLSIERRKKHAAYAKAQGWQFFFEKGKSLQNRIMS